MSVTTTPARIAARRFALATGTAALATLAMVATVATAAHAATPDGYVTVQSCTAVSGSTTFTPGLRHTAVKQSGLLSATLSGCSSSIFGPEAGTGTLTAVLSGVSSVSAVSMTGTAVINWPASSGLNPSTGTVRLSGPVAGLYTVSGSITTGAYTGSPFGTQLFVTGTNAGANGTKAHPVKTQSFVNSAPFTASQNLG